MGNNIGAVNCDNEGSVGQTNEALESFQTKPSRVKTGHVCATERLRRDVLPSVNCGLTYVDV